MDMVYDDRLYNTQIDTRLDTFKLQYTNAEPYGVVTPNRTGVTVDVKYTESKKEALDIFLKTSYLSEVIGVGTAEKRNFLLIKGGFDFHINKLFDYDRNITVNLGAQMESTNRGGTEIETVDLSSTLIEAGLEAELVDKLDFLVGAKLFSTNGIEYAAVRDEYNNIFRYNTINIDQKETLLATGLKYRFNENIFLSAQFIKSNWKNNLKDEDSYNINRVLLLFDMRF